MIRVAPFLILLLGTWLFIAPPASLSQVTERWVTRNDSVAPRAIAVDSEGNTYIAGGIYRGTSGYNIALLKYDTAGVQQWMREYNGTGDDLDDPTAIALDTAGNIFLTGYSYRGPGTQDFQMITIKYGPGGDSLWARTYNGAANRDDRAFALAVDSGGNVYVTGHVNGILVSGDAGRDFMTIKYGPDGSQLWASLLNLDACSDLKGIAVDTAGNVFVTGGGLLPGSLIGEYITVRYYPNGDTAWVRTYHGDGGGSNNAKGIVLDDTGNAYITGVITASNGYTDYGTVKYDPAGTEQWVRTYDGPVNEDDAATGLVIDAGRNVTVTGTASVLSGSFVRDIATVQYNSDGDSLWARIYDGPGHSVDKPKGMAIDADGNIYITGSVIGPGFSGYPDYATMKYASNGDSLWVRYYNPANLLDEPASVAVDRTGSVTVTGLSTDSSYATGGVTIRYTQAAVAEVESTRVYTMGPAWNMVSIPLTLSDYSKTAVYPTAVSNAFYYDAGYSAAAVLSNGVGYWVKFGSAQGVSMTGQWRDVDSFAVNPDWNMVGSVSSPVDVSTITSVPPGMVTSNFFKFVPGAGFTASTTVEPGLAYWVKVTGAGKLILNASGGAPAAGQIRVIPTDEIPPPPPADGPDAKLPSAYSLGQNYPNPFNPGTTIRFDLPEAAVVNLVVYDMLGRTVALLADGKMEAGSHEVRFDAPALPGGVYFYRLRAGTFSETRKFTLLK